MRNFGAPQRLWRGAPAWRRGNIVVLTALMMVGLMGLLAFSVDTGFMLTMQTELNRSVDSAALAGAGTLVDGLDAASEKVVEYLVRNPVGNGKAIVNEAMIEQMKSEFLAKHGEELQVKQGSWNSATRTFTETNSLPSALKVSLTYDQMPLFFGRVLGRQDFSIHADSVAVYQPRDIMLSLDFSGSMNDDSEMDAIQSLGQAAWEANAAQMWADLGSPTYGNMGFAPNWVTIPTTTISSNTTWKGTSVDIVSPSNLTSVTLTFSTGKSQTINTSVKSGTFQGSGSNAGKTIDKVAIKIGTTTETVDFYNDAHIRRGLGLDAVTYPSSGSWNDYISFARSTSSSQPYYNSYVNTAGYRRKFGVKTLLAFWLENKPASSQTPDLWKVSAQPVTALKDAVDLFVDYVGAVDTDDRVGLAIYNANDGEAITESALTSDLSSIATIVRHRQAGHYTSYTNIGAGMHNARLELQSHARTGAFKMIVAMTDGNANWVNGGYDTAAARQYVLDEAALCKAAKIPVVTVTFGAGADTSLMEDVAELTDGAAFHVPGGTSVSSYTEDLLETFKKIATARPLKLVQ